MADKNKKQTHYEVLNLKEDCSPQDIRNAFVSLSKSCHPDANPNDKNLHTKFIDVSEAYSVLSKPTSRRNYDLTLSFSRSNRINVSSAASGMQEAAGGVRYKVWRDQSIWEMRDKSQDRPIDPDYYYGIRGLRRVGNTWVVAGALFFMFVGSVFHFVTLKSTSATTVQQLDQRDRTLGMKLFLARQQAIRNGNERQIEILEEKWAKFEADRAAGK